MRITKKVPDIWEWATWKDKPVMIVSRPFNRWIQIRFESETVKVVKIRDLY